MVRGLKVRRGNRSALRQAVIETLEQRQLLSTVSGAYLFYNNSAFDGKNAAISASDDAAIATDKQPLRELQSASFANYSSYSRGLNGLMIDIANPNGTPTLGDFVFRAGNDANDPFAWSAAPAPSSFAIRQGAGANGADRIEFTWNDASAVKGKWLQVTVRANERTSVFANDTFYFGSAIGEVGDKTGTTRVDATDMLLVRNNRTSGTSQAAVSNRYDINRDKIVDMNDVMAVRNNITDFRSDLKLVTAPLNPITDLQSEILSPTSLRLIWQKHSSANTGYSVQYAPSNTGPFIEVQQISADATASLVTGLSSGCTYYFRVVPLFNQAVSPSPTVKAVTVAATTPERLTSAGNPLYTYKVTLSSTSGTRGNAGYPDPAGSISFNSSHPDGTVNADSASEAFWMVISGTIRVTNYAGEPHDYTVDQSGAFAFGTSGTLAASHPGFHAGELPATAGNNYLMTIEDTFEWTRIDSDYDDFYWQIKVEQVPKVWLQVINNGDEGRPGAGPVDGKFVMHRNMTVGSLDVPVRWNPIHCRGADDFSFPVTVAHFDAGQDTSQEMLIHVEDDSIHEFNDRVELYIDPSPDFVRGIPSYSVIEILDNDISNSPYRSGYRQYGRVPGNPPRNGGGAADPNEGPDAWVDLAVGGTGASWWQTTNTGEQWYGSSEDGDGLTTGGALRLNSDFDESATYTGSGVPARDKDNAGIVVGDDDLSWLGLGFWTDSADTDGTWTLQWDDSKVHVYFPELQSDGTYSFVQQGSGVSGLLSETTAYGYNYGWWWYYDVTALVEAVTPSGSVDDTVFNASFTPDNGGEVKDEVKCTVYDVDLDIDSDSDNTNGFGAPDQSAKEDWIEGMAGTAEHSGKVVQSNLTIDEDGDGIVDTLDGFNADGIAGNADDRTSGHFSQVVMDLPSLLDPAVATINVSYPFAAVTLWNADKDAARSLSPISANGNWIVPGTYTAAQLGLSGSSRSITFYVDGLSPSTAWGGSYITVSIDPDGAGPAGYVASDTVNVTVVDIQFKAYVVEPYVKTGDKRVLFQADFSSPEAMRSTVQQAFFTGADNLDKDQGWHGHGAPLGHAFCELTFKDPDHSIHEYFGSTGQNGPLEYLQTFADALSGTLPWTRFRDGEKNSGADLLTWWINNTHKIYASGTAATADIDLVQQHTWVIQPSVADGLYKLLMPYNSTTKPYGRDYSNYGLDIGTTQGGCASLVGVVMQAVGFTDQGGWKISKFAPANRLVDQSQWGTQPPDSDHLLLTFFDTGLMGTWMRGQQDKTTYFLEDSQWDGQTAVWPSL